MTENAIHSLYGAGHVKATRTRECVAMPGVREQTVFTPPVICEIIYYVWPEGIYMDPCGRPEGNVRALDIVTWPERSGLDLVWPEFTYCNPPYSDLKDWMEHALEFSRPELFMLVPARTHRKWWRRFVRELPCHVAELNPLKFWEYPTEDVLGPDGKPVRDANGKKLKRVLSHLPIVEAKQSAPFPVDLLYNGERVEALEKALRFTGVGELRLAA